MSDTFTILLLCMINRIEKILEFLQQTPNDNFLRHALALEYIKQGDDTKAQQLFENILNASPDYVGSYYHLGKLLERNNKTTQAIACYEKGMNIAKSVNDNHAYTELQAAYEDLAF